MYKVAVRFKSDSPCEYIADIIGLFDLCWTLENSDRVVEFKVEHYMPKDFGWAEFKKWVLKFDWSKE